MTKAQKHKITIKSLLENAPWDIAGKHGLSYTGDLCPVPHGGLWYSTKDWSEHDYACGVRICTSEDCLWIEEITINRPNPKDLAAALSSCGPNSDEIISGIHEIEAVVSYCGAEIDFSLEFREGKNGFPEREIMKIVKEKLISLANQ